MINSFKGIYSFLSNFYIANVLFEGVVYKSAEHAYQAAKTTENVLRIPFAIGVDNFKTPGNAKREGNKLVLRENWDKIKVDIMRSILKSKFELDGQIMRKLIKTGDELLVEGNVWHDNFWGDCYCLKCREIEGKNNLGKILMELRSGFIECE